MCKNEQKPELESCYRKRAPRSEQCHFYDGSAALVVTSFARCDGWFVRANCSNLVYTEQWLLPRFGV